MAALFEFSQQAQGSIKQADVVLTQHVVVLVALVEFGITRHRHVRRSVGQRLHQAQPDHVRSCLIAGLGSAHIDDGRLNAAHDELRGIVQRPVPVEGDQIKIQGAGHGQPMRQVLSGVQLAR